MYEAFTSFTIDGRPECIVSSLIMSTKRRDVLSQFLLSFRGYSPHRPCVTGHRGLFERSLLLQQCTCRGNIDAQTIIKQHRERRVTNRQFASHLFRHVAANYTN